MLIKSGGINSVLMLWKCNGHVTQEASAGKIWFGEFTESEKIIIFI